MVPCPRPVGWLLVVLLGLTACTGSGDADLAATEAPTDPELVADVAGAFATYRSAVAQGDGAVVVDSLNEPSRARMSEVVELARSADEETVRELPAVDQLLVLTYRIRPELLEADDPYRALADAGLAGQDRSLGDLGDVSRIDDDAAIGVVVDSQTREPTPLRWRFTREEGTWRLDLVEAHRLVSTTIANGAARAGVPIDDVVAATVADLSGEDREVVEALYTEPPQL